MNKRIYTYWQIARSFEVNFVGIVGSIFLLFFGWFFLIYPVHNAYQDIYHETTEYRFKLDDKLFLRPHMQEALKKGPLLFHANPRSDSYRQVKKNNTNPYHWLSKSCTKGGKATEILVRGAVYPNGEVKLHALLPQLLEKGSSLLVTENIRTNRKIHAFNRIKDECVPRMTHAILWELSSMEIENISRGLGPRSFWVY